MKLVNNYTNNITCKMISFKGTSLSHVDITRKILNIMRICEIL